MGECLNDNHATVTWIDWRWYSTLNLSCKISNHSIHQNMSDFRTHWKYRPLGSLSSQCSNSRGT